MLPYISEAVRAFNDESHKLYSGAMLEFTCIFGSENKLKS